MSRLRTWVVTGALALGATAGAAAVAQAASNGSSTGSSSTSPPAFAAGRTNAPPGGNPGTMAHGPGETLLTGATAAKARAAAHAAVPGATVIRVETDSAGAAYEAHLRKADGSYVTVKLDRAFTVTAIQRGFGAAPAQPAGTGSTG